ncbi:MAG: IS1 family transposase [Chloroflexi bacterium]|nr:IS1 family transposase [Chloroflexota bacterium]
MNPQEVFCPNPACPASGQIGKDNIGVHSRVKGQYMCHTCNTPFSARRGTPFYRVHTQAETITLVLNLVAHGCPVEAIVAAFGFQARTVRGWIERAGAHCERVHNQLVVHPRDLGQVQADEIRVKTQKGVVWMAMALMVTTRLWLGGVCSPSRNRELIEGVVSFIYRCALPSPLLPLLIAVDGLASYVGAVQRAFRSPVYTGHRGRPRLVPWEGVVIGQVVKQYVWEGGKRVGLEVSRRLAQGTWEQLGTLIERTQGWGVLNTAYIERLNATFRARLACLTRRTRNLARSANTGSLHAGMYLVGTVYNFCCYHQSLLSERGVKRTPAMAAGITDHRWSLWELLWYRVPEQVAPTPTVRAPAPQLRLLSRSPQPQQELAA